MAQRLAGSTIKQIQFPYLHQSKFAGTG